MRFVTKRTAILAASAFGVAIAAAAPASAQDLRRETNGGWSVHYPGPCNVFYGPDGRRTLVNPRCTRQQMVLADDMVRNAYNDRGYGRRGDYQFGYGGREPRVRVYNNGSGYVDFMDGCYLRYNRSGNRMSDSRACNREQRRYADIVYRQQMYGGSRGDSRYGYDYARPYADYYGGLIRVRLSNLNCTYMYTRQGNHVQTLGRDCNSQLRQIANDEARRYQRSRGW